MVELSEETSPEDNAILVASNEEGLLTCFVNLLVNFAWKSSCQLIEN